jgi:hypothetical protein
VRPGRVITARAAISTPGMKDERSVESCRIVSVCPCPPKMTSWCATRPGRRTEWMRIPSTSPPRAPSIDSPSGPRQASPRSSWIRRTVAIAVPEGASAFWSWCSSMISTAGR